ncbi:hypothetical protein [Bacillus suaedaesalsae]|uniref:Uncharacterized protein n=1 Tax=Bacillus suaedaesalsae TaxID=2810349 RepID=A0ABS2DFK5_9BACI|nr:hypothetical protein [Bacillus suaedaesalsae]MBM6617258.1 hypothetical protein [Bacillus suaedaesalsae]
MRKRTKITIVLSFIIAISYILVSTVLPNFVKESITYFPIDPNLTFLTSETNLEIEGDSNDPYNVKWNVKSETDKEVYLRQDVSLLYRDGLLVDTTFEWKQNKATLEQEKEIQGQDSTLYESISFHHAEIHENENNIKSSQKMTKDKLYVIDSSFSPLHAFHSPSNKEQEEWKKIIDHVRTQDLRTSWQNVIQHFSINPNNYDTYTLMELEAFNSKAIPGLSLEETQTVIGRLWEGLYKNYVLGIRLSESESISPIGSKMPLILISKDRTHLQIITEGKDGEKVKLLQQL